MAASEVGATQSEESAPTIWEEFQRKRERKARPYIHCLILASCVAWTIHVTFGLALVATDEATRPLFEYLLFFKAVMVLPLGLGAIITGATRFEKLYSAPLAWMIFFFITWNFAESVSMDYLIRTRDLYDGNDSISAAAVFASRTVGSHQVVYMCVLLSSVRLLVSRLRYLVNMMIGILILSVAIVAIPPVFLDGNLSYVEYDLADYVRVIVAVLATMLVNVYASLLWIEDEWLVFVQRKRFQLHSVRAEELLTLAMPRDIAHQLMMGETEPQEYTCVSVGFLYISKYAAHVREASSNGTILDFMEHLHRLYCELDALVLTHPNVYKIESVTNCYMVAGGVPNESSDHAQAVLSFCLEAVYLCHQLQSCGKQDSGSSSGAKKLIGSTQNDFPQLKFKIGVHSGPVTSGIVGKTRTFYRVFGDTVNVASRMGTSSSPGNVHASQRFYEELGSPPVHEQLVSGTGNVQYMVTGPQLVELKGKGELSTYTVTTNVEAPQAFCKEEEGSTSPTFVQYGQPSHSPEHKQTTEIPEKSSAAETTDRHVSVVNPRQSYDGLMTVHNAPRHQEKSNRVVPTSSDSHACNRVVTSFNNSPFATRGLSTQNDHSTDDYYHSENITKFDKAQRTVVAVAKLMRMPLKEALTAYKHMSDILIQKSRHYYIGKVEQIYIQRFLSKYSATRKRSRRKSGISGSARRRSMPRRSSMEEGRNVQAVSPKRSEYSKEDQNMYERTIAGNIYGGSGTSIEVHKCFFLRPGTLIRLITTRFPDKNLEETYQRHVNSLVYKLAARSNIFATVFFVWGIAGYSQGLLDRPGELMLYAFGVALIIVMVHVILRRFSYLQNVELDATSRDASSEGDSEDRSSEESPSPEATSLLRGTENSLSTGDRDARSWSRGAIGNRRKGKSLVLDSGITVPLTLWERLKGCVSDWLICDSIRRPFEKALNTLTAWVAAVMWLTMAVLTALDQSSLSVLHPELGPSERCLHSFLPPIVLVSAFQIFRMDIRVQLACQYIATIVFALGFLISERMIHCQGEVQGIGFFLMGFILIVSTIDAIVTQIRYRRAIVLQFASKHAKEESDIVLNQLLPKAINDRLEKNQAIPFEMHPDDVVILWADLMGFTKLSSELHSTQVMQLLNRLYSRFDKIVEDENLWKMDTIGDAYVVIGGLVHRSDNARLAESLFSIADKMVGIMRYFRRQTGHDIGIRVGIHAGKVASGIIGTLRPRYYVFGDTLLEAEKMESSSASDQIKVSEVAARLYRSSQFQLQPSGDKTGDLQTYWLLPPDPADQEEQDLTE
eukprot:gb/GECG01010157.1/.p1 GENE.gb/GECG01010157.1/~~gb/GECG01010157.1/.p1  ORF type:complete len:1289 (+),score=131.12 gb/GECG01010157.1/:1-3867(+)